jgi:hypothetical protein
MATMLKFIKCIISRNKISLEIKHLSLEIKYFLIINKMSRKHRSVRKHKSKRSKKSLGSKKHRSSKKNFGLKKTKGMSKKKHLSKFGSPFFNDDIGDWTKKPRRDKGTFFTPRRDIGPLNPYEQEKYEKDLKEYNKAIYYANNPMQRSILNASTGLRNDAIDFAKSRRGYTKPWTNRKKYTSDTFPMLNTIRRAFTGVKDSDQEYALVKDVQPYHLYHFNANNGKGAYVDLNNLGPDGSLPEEGSVSKICYVNKKGAPVCECIPDEFKKNSIEKVVDSDDLYKSIRDYIDSDPKISYKTIDAWNKECKEICSIFDVRIKNLEAEKIKLLADWKNDNDSLTERIGELGEEINTLTVHSSKLSDQIIDKENDNDSLRERINELGEEINTLTDHSSKLNDQIIDKEKQIKELIGKKDLYKRFVEGAMKTR